jgi:hypothetical protein
MRGRIGDVLRTAWGPSPPPPCTLMFSGTSAMEREGVVPCDALNAAARLGLADMMLASCLQMAYSSSASVAAFGRDIYIDTMAAELQLSGSLATVCFHTSRVCVSVSVCVDVPVNVPASQRLITPHISLPALPISDAPP